MYEGNWRPDDMDAMDEKLREEEANGQFEGMRIFDPSWTDEFLEEIALMCGKALNEGMSEEEAIEEVAAQTGYSCDEISSMWDEFRARL